MDKDARPTWTALAKQAFAGLVMILLGVPALVAFFSDRESKPSSAAESPAQVPPARPVAASLPQPAAAAPKEPRFKPEMLVRFTVSSPACWERQQLGELLIRLDRGERTKAGAMFIDQGNEDGVCVMLDPRKTYKVLSVEDFDAIPELGQLEIVVAGSRSGRGAWTLQSRAEPVAANPKK